MINGMVTNSDKPLKVDEIYIKTFLGINNDIVSLISPMKHIRVYAKKGGSKNDVIFVLTKYLNENLPNDIKNNLNKYGAIKHQCKNHVVYSFK